MITEIDERGSKAAHSILGDDFISPEEIATASGISYTEEQLSKFSQTLPAQAVLEWCHRPFQFRWSLRQRLLGRRSGPLTRSVVCPEVLNLESLSACLS